jgi:hypothetical protein
MKMARPNPGPFEPAIYFIQTPGVFRIAGLVGFTFFAIISLAIAATYGFIFFLIGIALFAAHWLDQSLAMCRRCRFYGSWHCMGQGMLVSRLFSRLPSQISDTRMIMHLALTTLFILYGLFWLWHSIVLGIIFTIWLPVAVLSAINPNGFSWKRPGRAVAS